MMEVDQPVVSKVDKNMKPSTPETVALEASTSADIIVRENDDLPALVISDSEADDTPEPTTCTEKIKPDETREDVADITGVSALEVSVIEVDTSVEECKSGPSGWSVRNNSIANLQNKTAEIFDDIDLTGVSSAEDSAVSDHACGTSGIKTEECVKKVIDDCASLTAQELLQSLIGTREDESTSNITKEGAQPAECSDMIKFNDDSLKEQRQQKSGDVLSSDEKNSVSNTPECRLAVPKQNEGTETDEANSEAREILNSESPLHNLDQTEKAAPASNVEKNNATICEVVEETSDDIFVVEEMNEVIVVGKGLEEEDSDNNSLTSSSVADGDEMQILAGDIYCEKDASTRDKDTEDLENYIDEPPTKKARSSGRCEMNKETDIESTENESNSTILANFKGNHKETIENEEGETSKYINTVTPENQNKAKLCDKPTNSDKSFRGKVQPQSSNSSRPSSTVGDAATTMLVTNTTSEGIQMKKEQDETTVGGTGDIKLNVTSDVARDKSSHCTDVLVIDDDDDDEASVKESNHDKTKGKGIKFSPLDGTELIGKRLRDTDAVHVAKVPKLAKTEESMLIAGDVTQGVSSHQSNVAAVKSIKMEFLKRFAKPLFKMTRDDLEELVLQKVCEAMHYKSELADTHKKVEKLEKAFHGVNQRSTDVTKQYADLKLVHDRLLLDLKRKANRFVTPVKITRAVGLQVGTPLKHFLAARSLESIKDGGDQKVHPVGVQWVGRVAAGGCAINQDNTSVRPISATSQSGSSEPITNIVPKKTTSSNSVQQSNKHPAPNMIRTTLPMNVTFVHNSTSSAVTIRPTALSTPESGATAEALSCNSTPTASSSGLTNARTSARRNSTIASTSTLTNGGSASSSEAHGSIPTSPGTARKKTVHKITPMRPPLSPYQQEQQDQQARQQQALLLQEITSEQAQIAKLAANRKEQQPTAGHCPASGSCSNGDMGQPSSSRTSATQNRQMTEPAQTSSKNMRAAANRSPSIVSSTTPTVVRKPVSTSSPTVQQSRPPTGIVAVESLIDLTEEDDTPRISTVVGAGTAVMPNRTRPSQNGMPSHQQIAANQIERLSQMTRAPHKERSPYRPDVVNGGASTSATAAPGVSGTSAVRSGFNSGTGGKPILIKRPHDHAEQVAQTESSMMRPPRLSVPFDQPMMVRQRGPVKLAAHPAPLPLPGPQVSNPEWKEPPPQPTIRINNVPTGIVISWSMPELTSEHSGIKNYQIYAYQETSTHPTADAWRHVGDVRSLPLPMAVTLTHFHKGQRYHFAVRAIDEHKRVGHFSDPRTWNEVNVVSHVIN